MEKQTIKALIFDMGGVLLRTEDPSARVRLAEQHAIPLAALEQLIFASESSLRAETGELSTGEHWRQVCEQLGLNIEQAAELERVWFSGDRFDVELIDFIRSLRPQYKTALLSNAWDTTREIVIGLYDFSDAFDVLIFSAEVGMRKPDPAIFRLMLDRLQVEPGEAIFVDDVQANVAGAQAIGLQAVQFKNTDQARRELQAMLKNHAG